MFKNNVTDHKLNVEAIIKNINIISLELKKMKGKHGIPELKCLHAIVTKRTIEPNCASAGIELNLPTN